MRLKQHVLPLCLRMLAACAGQDQISGTNAGISAVAELRRLEWLPP